MNQFRYGRPGRRATTLCGFDEDETAPDEAPGPRECLVSRSGARMVVLQACPRM